MPEERTTSATGAQKGVKNARFDLVPVEPLWMLAEHYAVGAKKYAEHNWRKGYEWSKSYSAIMRHLMAFWGGENFDICTPHKASMGDCLHEMDGKAWVMDDPNHPTCWNHTGSHHMVCVAWHSFALLEFLDKHPNYDDRFVYPPLPEVDDDNLPFGQLTTENLRRHLAQ